MPRAEVEFQEWTWPGTFHKAWGKGSGSSGDGGGWSYARLSLCSLLQTGVPGLDRSEAIKIRKGKTHHSHHNSQLRMGRQPWGQLPGP